MSAPSAERPDVRVRWARIPEGAARREVAWNLIRSLLPDPTARITNECPRCGGPHGPLRVALPRVSASVSYTAGFAFVGVVEDPAVLSLGIDAEPVFDGRRDAAGLVGIVRPGAATTPRAWTRIESVLKADGRGLRVDPGAVDFSESGAGGWTARVAGSARIFRGWDAPGPAGILASVAVEQVSAAAGAAAPAARATR